MGHRARAAPWSQPGAGQSSRAMARAALPAAGEPASAAERLFRQPSAG
jgi:hypothetical protein